MFININEFESAIVKALQILATSRKIVPYANPGDYDLANIPANGLGFVYVNAGNITTPEMPISKNFGPIITRPNINVLITLVQRGNYSHKLCYPTIELIISLLHGFEYQNSRMLFDNFTYKQQDKQDKCWQYDMQFNYAFDFLAEGACC